MSDLLDIADRVLGWAKDGEQVEVIVGRGRDTAIRVYQGEIEKLSSAESAGIGVRVINDGRQGFAYAGSLADDVLGDVLADARDNATFGDPDEHYGLAVPDGVPVPDLDVYRDALVSFATDAKVDLALELERLTTAADPRIAGIESCDYDDGAGETAVVTTTGIRTFSRETYCSLSAYALATDGDETKTGGWFSVGREPSELDAEMCARVAADRATRLLGATKPRTRRCTVVLDPLVTAQFLGIIGFAVSGENVLKGRSMFADRLGEEVASPLVSFVDDPTNPAAITATATDGEGLATRRNVLVRDGVLQGFLHNTYTARRMGTVSTGSATRGFGSTPTVGVRAVALDPGPRPPAELVADITDGILVQTVSGLHSGVNPISGDFSTGAEGLLIQDGEVKGPVREFTIGSTLQRMLGDVIAVGSDLTWLPMSAAGLTLVVGDVTVSGS